MPIYNKLVRDKIPGIIEKSGKKAHIHILDENDYREALDRKLGEEYAEYQADRNAEELADMLEVIYAIAETMGVSEKQLDNIRREKSEKRGAFRKRIFLEKVDE